MSEKKPQVNKKSTQRKNSKATNVVKTQSVVTPVSNKKVDIIKKLESKVSEKKNKSKDPAVLMDRILLGAIAAQVLVLVYMFVK